MRVKHRLPLDVRAWASRLRLPVWSKGKPVLAGWPSRASLLIAAALGCTLILVNSMIAYNSVRTLVAEEQAIAQTHTTQTALEAVAAALSAAENGERGYILTGDQRDLEPFTSASVQLPRLMDDLSGLTSGNAVQHQRVLALKPLVQTQIQELQTAVDLERDGHRDAALRVELSIDTKETKHNAQQVLSALDAYERQQLDRQDQAVQMSSRASYITVALSTLADLVLLAIIVYLAHRALARREQMAQERAALLAQEQEARREAEAAVGVRDRFLSVASHELRNPLTALLGNVQLLRRRVAEEGGLSARNQQTLEVIPRQAKRLRALIEAMLDVTRIDRGQLTLAIGQVDLAAIVRGVIDETRATSDVHVLRCEGAERPVYVAGDAVRLEQVLLNLVENAIKYSPAGGQVQVRLTQCDNQVQVAVSDEGIGIPEEARSRLFERFYRAPNAIAEHISGTGIGLYVIREIVALHGGAIEVASREGRGSTFTITLPGMDVAVPKDSCHPCDGDQDGGTKLAS